MTGNSFYFYALVFLSGSAAAICSRPGEYTAEIGGFSFPVLCVLESNGNIAISLELVDQFDRGMIINSHAVDTDRLTKCADISKFFDYLADDIFIGTDFDYLESDHLESEQFFTIDLSYRHPTSHYVYSYAELDAIRGVTSGLSIDTRMVVVDGDGDGDTHQVYIRTSSVSFELTPGSSGDCDNGAPPAYYIWSTNPKASQMLNVVDFAELLPGLPAELAIPDQLVTEVNSVGGVAWGYERRNLLLPLQEQHVYSVPDLFERHECIHESDTAAQSGHNSYTFMALDCSLTDLEYANLAVSVEEERCVGSLLWSSASSVDTDWRLDDLTVWWYLASGGGAIRLKAQYLCW